MTLHGFLPEPANAFISAADAFDIEATVPLLTSEAAIDGPSTGRRRKRHAGIRDYLQRALFPRCRCIPIQGQDAFRQLESFVAKSGLAGWQKEEVLASPDKTKEFQEHRAVPNRHACPRPDHRSGHGTLVEDQMDNEHPPLKFNDRLKSDIDRRSIPEISAFVKFRLCCPLELKHLFR
ncbi:hypothetical protein D3C81_630750 [compost metagenome]